MIATTGFSAIIHKYPTLPWVIGSNLLDMIVGTKEYQKSKFDAVMGELLSLTTKDREKISRKAKSYALKRYLVETFTGYLISFDEIEMSSCVLSPDGFYYKQVSFLLEWNEWMANGPKVIRLSRRHCTHEWTISAMVYHPVKAEDGPLYPIYAPWVSYEAEFNEESLNELTELMLEGAEM